MGTCGAERADVCVLCVRVSVPCVLLGRALGVLSVLLKLSCADCAGDAKDENVFEREAFELRIGEFN